MFVTLLRNIKQSL